MTAKNCRTSRTALTFLAAILLPLTSCSLNYSQGPGTEEVTPELIFSDTTFHRYEKASLSMELNAATIEQYKKGSSFASNARFKTWNDSAELETEGRCALIDINSKDSIYTLFNEILIKNYSQNVEIQAQALRWNANTEQLTSKADDTVYLKKDDVAVKGTGFSASGAGKSFVFSGSVEGTIIKEDNDEVKQQ